MFTLFDANNKVLGTYRTHKGALIAVAKRKAAIYETFDNRKDKGNNLVWEIKEVQDVNNPEQFPKITANAG